MRILYLSMIVVLVFSTLLYIKPIQADNENGVVIQNIQTLPTTIIIGHTFKINATLVNNSTTPIFVEHGSCGAPFSVTFDNHVVVRTNNVTCTLQLIEQRLDPGTKITSTSPNLDLTYVAAENGTVNATVSFPYDVWNPTFQSNTKENISKPFSFMIYPKTRVPTLSIHDNQAIIDVALAIPDLQKWSNDWQYVSMGFMTAKNQPGNWQYATVNLKASSDSSLVPCKNGWDAMVTIDRTTMKVISAWYPTMESHNCDNYPTGGGPQSYGGFMTKINTPLKQFKSGIAIQNVQCKDPLILVLSIHDTPACLNAIHLTALYPKGWIKEIIESKKLFQEIPNDISANFFQQIKTNATVLIGKSSNAIGVPLDKMIDSSEGITWTKPDKFGRQTQVHDNNHVLLTMYQGNSANGTIVVITATNIDSKQIRVQNFEIQGGYWFPVGGSREGGELLLMHDVPIGNKDASQCNCVGNPYPTVEGPILLEPNESVTAYVGGTLVTRNLPLNWFSASVGYEFNDTGNLQSFLISDQFTNVKG